MTQLNRYELVSKFIHNQTDEQWGILVKTIIDNQGALTGEYPTNFVTREDIISIDNECDPDTLTDILMQQLAECVGESDTEYGTYWTSLQEAYYDLTRE